MTITIEMCVGAIAIGLAFTEVAVWCLHRRMLELEDRIAKLEKEK